MKNSIFVIFITTFACLLGVGLFNYHVDPLCFYQCHEIDTKKPTRNHYYHVAQKIKAHLDTEVIILGSSRGQTTPPLWYQSVTGKKTLNLSIGGAELFAKIAFLNISLESLKLKEVIWFADYFELITSIADVKIRNTPALRKYLDSEIGEPTFWDDFKLVQSLIDHNTLEASFYALGNKEDPSRLDQGAGTGINFQECLSDSFKGTRTQESLDKEIGLTYDTYTRNVLNKSISDSAWSILTKKISELAAKNIKTTIVIPPYHPQFSARLQREYPQLFDLHLQWTRKLKTLSGPMVRVLDFFQGLPNPDPSPKYWDDGVHFTCRGSIEMLSLF